MKASKAVVESSLSSSSHAPGSSVSQVTGKPSFHDVEFTFPWLSVFRVKTLPCKFFFFVLKGSSVPQTPAHQSPLPHPGAA